MFRWSRHVFETTSFELYVCSCHLVFDVSLPISASLKDQSCRHFRIRFIESRSRRNVLTRFDYHLHLQIQLSSRQSIHHPFNISLVIVVVVRLVEYSVVIRSNVRKCKCSSWHVISYTVFVLVVLPYPIPKTTKNRVKNHSFINVRRSSVIIVTIFLQNSAVYKFSHYLEIDSHTSNTRFFKEVNFETFLEEYEINDSWSIWTGHSTRYVVRSMSSLTNRHLVSDFIDSLLSCAL